MLFKFCKLIHRGEKKGFILPKSYYDNRREYYYPVTSFKALAEISELELNNFFVKYPQCRITESGIPIFAFLRAVNNERRVLAKSLGMEECIVGAEQAIINFEKDMNYEKLLKEKILNQTKLQILIPKARAEERITTAMRTVVNMLKHVIKEVAPKLGEPRIIESILTDSWNLVVEEAEKNAKKVSWEQDGSTDLLKTTLVNLERDDPIFSEVAGLQSKVVKVDGEDNEIFEETDLI
jgi:hypothetical protein